MLKIQRAVLKKSKLKTKTFDMDLQLMALSANLGNNNNKYYYYNFYLYYNIINNNSNNIKTKVRKTKYLQKSVFYFIKNRLNVGGKF